MNASTLRANARQTLQGRWGKAALVVLAYFAVAFLLNFLNVIPLIGGLAIMLVSVPMSYGMVATFMKFKRNEDFTYTTFLSEGFANFKKVWFVTLHTALKLLPWIALLFVSIFLLGFSAGMSAVNPSAFSGFLGFLAIIVYFVAIVMLVIKGFSYSVVYFILYDEPNLSAKEIVEKSASLMENNKMRFFCLNLSFIGWAILSVFTFGIGMFFLAPYIQIADIHFYEDLTNKNVEQ